MEESDKKLIEKAQRSGDYEEVYETYSNNVYRYLLFRVGRDHDIAEDLTQDTFLRAYRALPRYEYKEFSYLTYLLTIAHNLLANYYRQKKTLPLEEAEKIMVEIMSSIQARIDAQILWEKVQELSIPEKNAVLMKYRDDMSIKDIAFVLDKSENAVKLILSRARAKLKRFKEVQYLAKNMV